MTVAIVTGRDSAKKTKFVLNAVSSNYAAVGAAIGRPPVNIHGNEKERECSNGKFRYHRSGACKNDTRDLNANCFPAAAGRTSDARPYNDWVF